MSISELSLGTNTTHEPSKEIQITKRVSRSALRDTSLFEVTTDVKLPHEDPLFIALSDKLNHRVPFLFDYNEAIKEGSVRIALPGGTLGIGSSGIHPQTGLPSRLFFGSIQAGHEGLACYGAIEGPQFYTPFVGYIETASDLRRQGVASGILPILNTMCQNVYGSPLSGGPESYLSDDGQALQTSLESTHSLPKNQQGFVSGRESL